MNIRELIPTEKGDEQGIDQLQQLSFEQIEPIIPDLLKWLLDINWPVAWPVVEVLRPFGDKLATYILPILKGDDDIWKLWVLSYLVNKTTDTALLQEIERIATHPTPGEIEEDVHLEAIGILKKSIQ